MSFYKNSSGIQEVSIDDFAKQRGAVKPFVDKPILYKDEVDNEFIVIPHKLDDEGDRKLREEHNLKGPYLCSACAFCMSPYCLLRMSVGGRTLDPCRRNASTYIYFEPVDLRVKRKFLMKYCENSRVMDLIKNDKLRIVD